MPQTWKWKALPQYLRFVFEFFKKIHTVGGQEHCWHYHLKVEIMIALSSGRMFIKKSHNKKCYIRSNEFIYYGDVSPCSITLFIDWKTGTLQLSRLFSKKWCKNVSANCISSLISSCANGRIAFSIYSIVNFWLFDQIFIQ